MSNEVMSKEFIFRALNQIKGLLESYIDLKQRNPNELTRMMDYRAGLSYTISILNDREKDFMNWLTENRGKDYYNVAMYGLVDGIHYEQSYDRICKFLQTMLDTNEDFDSFGYIYNEYNGIIEAENTQLEIEDRTDRTCPKCETRFDSIEGMHRHKSRCKGDENLSFQKKMNHPAYRGEYKSRVVQSVADGWSGGNTSEW